MAIEVEIERRKTYTKIQNYPLLYDNRLSPADKGVLLFLLSQNPETWGCSQKGLAGNSAKDGIDKVKACIKHLKELGYLNIEQKRNPKTQKIEKYIYHIREVPPDVDESLVEEDTKFITIGVDEKGEAVGNATKMMIEKVDDDYCLLSNYHLRDKNLSWAEKGELSTLLALRSDFRFSFDRLSKKFKASKDTVMKIFHELQEDHYVYQEQTRDNKGHITGTLIKVRMTPGDFKKDDPEEPKQPVVNSKKPEAEFSDMDADNCACPYPKNPHQENPHHENPPHNNNSNKTNTYINNYSLSSSKSKQENKSNRPSSSRTEMKKKINEKVKVLIGDVSVNQTTLTLFINTLVDVYASDTDSIKCCRKYYNKQTIINNFESLDISGIKGMLAKIDEINPDVPVAFMLTMLSNGFRNSTRKVKASPVELSSKPSYDLARYTQRAIYDKLEFKKRNRD